MQHIFLTAAIGVTLSMTACALHPLPEDFTGVPTDMIVRKIRCETRGSIKSNLTQWLQKVPNDPATNTMGVEFDKGARPLNTFTADLFHGPVKAIVQKFQDTAIGYDFTFDMTETNNLDATLDLVQVFRRAIGMAALSGGIDRMRENIRTFTITDSFIDLLRDIKEDYCSQLAFEKDYMYPITGTIGVGEMIHTFVDLALFENLSGNKGGPPTMGDTITFTTKLSGSATPKIVFTPVGSGFHAVDASLTAAASRTDAHKVIVSLALPPPSPPTLTGTSPTPPPTGATGTQMQSGLFVTAVGTPAQLLAAQTIQQIILRFELGKPCAVVVTTQ